MHRAQAREQGVFGSGRVAGAEARPEAWRPAQSCAECCPERRANFAQVVGIPELELAGRGELEAYPAGRWRHRRIVDSDYGSWRYSDAGLSGA